MEKLPAGILPAGWGKLASNVQKFVDLGLVEADDDVLADLDDRHAHLTAHLLHIAGGHRVARDVDLLEFDVVGPEILHGPLAPTAGWGCKNDDFRLFLFLFNALFFDLNSHVSFTFLVCFDEMT